MGPLPPHFFCVFISVGLSAFQSVATNLVREESLSREGSKKVLAIVEPDGTTTQIQTAQSKLGALKAHFPWYHTSDEIHQEARRLSHNCGGALAFSTVTGGNGVHIDVAHIRIPGSSPRNRAFLMFGEHARELISPETGLHLLRLLCGETDLSGKGAEVLQDTEFKMILNGNPRSRSQVEHGDFCLRANPNGVDLERNFDEHWGESGGSRDSGTDPGTQPFSEPETMIFRKLITNFRPTMFITVHSGTKGMYVPYAFSAQAPPAHRNLKAMLNIVKAVDATRCNCPFGVAAKELGYAASGSDLDWVYDKLDVPYSFAVEIGGNALGTEEMLKARWEEKLQEEGVAELRDSGESLSHPAFRSVFEKHPSHFVTASSKNRLGDPPKQSLVEEDPLACFDVFNFRSEEEYAKVVKNWAGALLDMAHLVSVDLPADHSFKRAAQ